MGKSTSLSQQILEFADRLTWNLMPSEVQDAAKKHLIDTIGVIIAGLDRNVASAVLNMRLNEQTEITADGLAHLFGCAAHGLELDDGYRQGTTHPGVSVIPALLAACLSNRISGKSFLTGLVAGYEACCAISEAMHPELRKAGFHPTSITGPLGTAIALANTLGLTKAQSQNAFGISGSSSAGLFAFINGGVDVKRLHAGQSARAGLEAVLIAKEGILGPPDILESKHGVFDAFIGAPEAGVSTDVSLENGWRILQCYIKPHACCRHLQPAFEALCQILDEHELDYNDVTHVKVETYSIAASHAAVDWSSFSNAQLSFHYVLGLAMKMRRAPLEYFEGEMLLDEEWPAISKKFEIVGTEEMDALYPDQRPARVSVAVGPQIYEAYAPEALGGPEFPIDRTGVDEKFLSLVVPRLGEPRAKALLDSLWGVDQEADLHFLLREILSANDKIRSVDQPVATPNQRTS